MKEDHLALELLIVDNRQEMATALGAHFERCGFDVMVATDGAIAKDVFQTRNFVVALIFEGVPKIDGLTLGRGFRETAKGKQMGLVLLAKPGVTRDPAMELLDREVFDGWFDPPLSLDSLEETISNLAQRFGRAKPTPTPRSFPIPIDLDVDISSSEQPPLTNKAPDSGGIDIGPEPVLEPHTVRERLLELARMKASGIFTLELHGSRADVAMLNGVAVGASDNLRENLLGERLKRAGLLTDDDIQAAVEHSQTHDLRLAESLLALGKCEAEVLLEQIDAQAQERLTLLVGSTDGWYVFRSDKAAARAMALANLDLLQAIIASCTRAPDRAKINAWIAAHRDLPLWKTDDFNAGLVSYSRVHPTSPLPPIVLMGDRTLGELLEDIEAQGHDPETFQAHLFAFCESGMMVAQEEEAELRPPVPVALAPEESVSWDRDAVKALSAEALRIRGRSLYEMLGVSPMSSSDELSLALNTYAGRWGPGALPVGRLGPAEPMANDLFGEIDRARQTLLDPALRSRYDEDLQTEFREPERIRSTVTNTSEALFSAGKELLLEGELEKAANAFDGAAQASGDEPEYRAYYGWALVLMGNERIKEGVDIIKDAHRKNPLAMRPLFFLGLIALRTEKIGFARRFLLECARRAPDDADVQIALQSLPEND